MRDRIKNRLAVLATAALAGGCTTMSDDLLFEVPLTAVLYPAEGGDAPVYGLATAEPGTSRMPEPVAAPVVIRFDPGLYRCELKREVLVHSVAADRGHAMIKWRKRDYRLTAVQARSGALRYEDPISGLMWIVILDKSMLLDTKHGRQLANECRL